MVASMSPVNLPSLTLASRLQPRWNCLTSKAVSVSSNPLTIPRFSARFSIFSSISPVLFLTSLFDGDVGYQVQQPRELHISLIHLDGMSRG